MKTNNAISLIIRSLVAVILLSQLAACNFMAAATGIVGDVPHSDAGDFDTEIIADGADSIVDVTDIRTDETNSSTDVTNISTDETGSGAVVKILSWIAPSAREDESPLSMAEIASFRVYYGTTQGEYPQYVEINDAYIDEIDLNNINLQPATYYIVMTTIDTGGRESAFSEVITFEV